MPGSLRAILHSRAVMQTEIPGVIPRAKLGPSWVSDRDKPIYHVSAKSGWLNDPNGPIFINGRYHMFYQHIEDSSDWAWRMCWGHASSEDLVRWVREPMALRPTQGGPDDKGCWSGCCAVDQHGVPTILYTGVRMGSGPNSDTADGIAVGQPVVELQCAATAAPDDERLLRWTKLGEPVIPGPPPDLQVMGFRDPYVIETGGGGRRWRIVLGSGIAGAGGTLLVYSSPELTSGWVYEGLLCVYEQRQVDGHDTGAMWECPFLVPLSSEPPEAGNDGSPSTGPSTAADPADADPADADSFAPGASTQTYVLCVSPYPHHGPSTNSCLYWLGDYRDGRFDIDAADGPHTLDLGDALYAPNCFRDGGGRRVMLAWLQEHGSRQTSFDYSGCITLPRVLTLAGGRLHQAPAPELTRLRLPDHSWTMPAPVTVHPAKSLPVPGVHGSALEVAVTLQPAEDATDAASVYLLSDDAEHRPYGGGEAPADDCYGVAVTVSWREKTLKVSWPQAVDRDGITIDLASAGRAVGGPVAVTRRDPVRLRVFLDHSALEVFLGTGEALSTRVYRRQAPLPDGVSAGVHVMAHGGSVAVTEGAAYLMGSIWT